MGVSLKNRIRAAYFHKVLSYSRHNGDRGGSDDGCAEKDMGNDGKNVTVEKEGGHATRSI